MSHLTPQKIVHNKNELGFSRKNHFQQTFSPQKHDRRKTLNLERKRKKTIQLRAQFHINPLHLSLLMQEQRSSEIETINKTQSLKRYYQSLLRLFKITYSASQIIIANIYDCRKTTTKLSGPGVLGVFISVAEHTLHEEKMLKLKVLAKNIIKMASTIELFQTKIQFVCRKISLNMNIRKKVQRSFLDASILNFWKSLIQNLEKIEQIEFLEQMFQVPAQRLAYWQFMSFINKYLCKQEFYQQNKILKKNPEYQNELDENKQFSSFTFQFKIIQLFCFNDDLIQIQNLKEQKNCQIF